MITVLGSRGFIGSHLVSALRQQGHAPYTPGRTTDLRGQHLGFVYYCIGITADFRDYPLETMTAHVVKLTEVLQECHYNGLIYLSSTRIYEHAAHGTEGAVIPVQSSQLSDIYTLSKLSGESLCLAQDNQAVKVVRLSNVYGPDWHSQNFLISILRDALTQKHVTLETSGKSIKDYISISDVVNLLPQIAEGGHYRLYNLASGIQVSHQQLLDQICHLCQASWHQTDNAPQRCFPAIDIHRLQQDFSYHPHTILDDIADLIAQAPYPLNAQER